MAADQPQKAWFCTLEFHDDTYSKETVVLNAERIPDFHLKNGTIAKVSALKSNVASQDFVTQASRSRDGARESGTLYDTDESSSQTTTSRSMKRSSKRRPPISENVERLIDYSKALAFIVHEAPSDQKGKKSTMQISIHTSARNLFGFSNRMQVVIFPAEHATCTAEFVELAFRDAYLARSDMWRVALAELSHKAVFKGQQLLFLGTVKATVRSIFIKGKKVSSAFYSPTTVPIFRSQSARYVFFIQMSQEMWEYDAEGSGEIMFNKVINGFLPDLFKRWQRLNVHHLVSIILFTRLEYVKGILKNPEPTNPSRKAAGDEVDIRDFYKVVSTDSASGDWIRILYDLKKEYRVFLRDAMILDGSEAYGRRPDTLAGVKDAPDMECVIAGRPTTAAKGNILEAINLASSQFSKDYIDRDLVRTGISVAIVTAGTGVFEVDYNMLKLTTDTLVGNGIGIDLVSLAAMPLHSVPLFRYHAPQVGANGVSLPPDLPATSSTPTAVPLFPRSTTSPQKISPSYIWQQAQRFPSSPSAVACKAEAQWSYALPHWIDISFWSDHSEAEQRTTDIDYGGSRKRRRGKSSFATSCRMYELQMMGLMENEMTDIAIPFLRPQPANEKSVSDTPSSVVVSSSLSRPVPVGSFESEGILPGPHSLSPRKSFGDPSNRPSEDVKHDLLKLMHRYDENTFSEIDLDKLRETQARALNSGVGPRAPLKESGLATLSHSHQSSATEITTISQSPHKQMQMIPGKEDRTSPIAIKRPTIARPTIPEPTELDVVVKKDASSKPRPNKSDHSPRISTPRQISIGPRGLGTMKGAPVASITSATATTLWATDQKANATPTGTMSGLLARQLRNTLQRKPSQQNLAHTAPGVKDDSTSTQRPERSRPISIKDSSSDSTEDSDHGQSATVKPDPDLQTRKEQSDASSDTAGKGPHSLGTTLRNETSNPVALSPLSALSPWLTLLNPSNPRKDNMNIASQFRRWQHVFPRAVPISVIKWKSLCSPAALPLTSEFFPTAEELKSDYIESPYRISLVEEDEMAEVPRTREALLREMVGSRLSHGFQVVIGADGEAYSKSHGFSMINIFEPEFQVKDGSTVLMTVGNNIHQLLCVAHDQIEVKRFVRKQMQIVESDGAVNPARIYHPYVRTILGATYERRQIIFKNPRPKYDWSIIDGFLAGNREENFSTDLRFWRARFVLIPIEQPKNARGSLTSVNEVSEEESRIEGIQKLTQMWQRHRYVPPGERRFQASVQKRRKDANPLAIDYQTRDPSSVVRAYAAGLADNLMQGEPTHQLFAEADLYHTNDFDLQKLSQHMQADPPKGIAVADRRWHWKLHYKCFRGDEFTSWLLVNFKDMETREDAVRLGNELMKRGLFTHVQQKHHFRDGNYFYQIASDYRSTAYPDSKAGWFTRMTDRSVPPTPMSETPKALGSVRGTPSSRPNTESTSEHSGLETPTKEKPRLELSRVLRYDVDQRKKSYRPEIINLHYDRIHNPDNCYHIRIDWVNVTAKFIEDAIVTWATSVERHGLRLVELPISEACNITKQHPFRAPYKVKLAVPAPEPKPKSYFDTSSFTPHLQEQEHPFQKALLRKWDFVLDLEAADSFDPNVDVAYSWGAPNYRYTQFIHKTGMLIAEIDDDGDFLLLSNNLCVNRAASAKDASKFERLLERQDRRGLGGTSSVPQTGAPTPYASPLARAANDPSTAAAASSTTSSKRNSTSGPPRRPADDAAKVPTTPEAIKDAFERFCRNESELLAFYEEAIAQRPPRASSPSPRQTTPVLRNARTPILDAAIPALGLPPRLELRSASYAPGGTATTGDSPRSLAGGTDRRLSAQGG